MSKAKLRKYREWNYLSIALYYNRIRDTYYWYDKLKDYYNKSHDWDYSCRLIEEYYYDKSLLMLDTPPNFWITLYGNFRNALKYACKHYYSELITLENILRYSQFKWVESDIRDIKGIGEKYIEYYED